MKISSYGVCQDVNDDAVRRALDRAMQIGIFHPGERGAVRDDDWGVRITWSGSSVPLFSMKMRHGFP